MKEYCIFKNNNFIDYQDIQNIDFKFDDTVMIYLTGGDEDVLFKLHMRYPIKYDRHLCFEFSIFISDHQQLIEIVDFLNENNFVYKKIIKI